LQGYFGAITVVPVLGVLLYGHPHAKGILLLRIEPQHGLGCPKEMAQLTHSEPQRLALVFRLAPLLASPYGELSNRNDENPS